MQFAWVIGIGSALALGLGAVSIALTHQTEWEEKPRDMRPLELAVEGVQSELDRLHSRYVDQLDALADEVRRSRGNTFGPQLTAEEIVGVRTVTLLSLNDDEKPIHMEIRERASGESAFEKERFPPLAFQEAGRDSTVVRVFDRDRFGGPEVTSGWIRESNEVFYYWRKIHPAMFVFIGVDGISLRGSINGWLVEEKSLAIHHLQSGAGEFTRVVGPDGEEILRSGEPVEGNRRPGIFPATIRFGSWQIQTWGAVVKTTSWNLPYLITGLALSLLLLVATVLVAIALRRATRLAERRVSFVNSASHELRSPITNMMLNVDLARELTEDDPAAATQRLDRVQEEAGRLSRLVDNLLTFSKSGKGTDSLRIESVVPTRILEETLEQFSALLERREISVEWENRDSVSLMADSDALSRIFSNLISNVEKYAASGKRLSIITESVDGIWTVDFKDDGPGVSPKFANRIFVPFWRASDQINEGVSGTGLGLTISRDLAHRHGGDLILVPSPTGAIFRLTLPATDS